jgi:hypothetical protein
MSKQYMKSTCPSKVFEKIPLSISHTFIVLSSEQLIILFFDNLTRLRIKSECALMIFKFSPLFKSQIIILPSLSLLAILSFDNLTIE